MLFLKNILIFSVLIIPIGLLGLVFISLQYVQPEPVWEPGQMAPDEVQVTIPEGFTVAQIEERLIKKGINIKLGDLQAQNLEGYLFPDTYRFYQNDTPEKIIKIMKDNFNSKVGLVDRDAVILASIVQKEVLKPQDMKIVAGIFKNRLERDYPLQSDATINFITGKGLVQPSIKDTKVDSPYNTYQNIGLPPGPICNPGLEAIKAVLNPAKTDYWYFLTLPNMETVYSKTFQQHKSAKQKFLN